MKTSALKMTSTIKNKVTFSDVVTYFNVPGHEEDRRGTWEVDNERFFMRVKAFEPIFLSMLHNTKLSNNIENRHALTAHFSHDFKTMPQSEER